MPSFFNPQQVHMNIPLGAIGTLGDLGLAFEKIAKRKQDQLNTEATLAQNQQKIDNLADYQAGQLANSAFANETQAKSVDNTYKLGLAKNAFNYANLRETAQHNRESEANTARNIGIMGNYYKSMLDGQHSNLQAKQDANLISTVRESLGQNIAKYKDDQAFMQGYNEDTATDMDKARYKQIKSSPLNNIIANQQTFLNDYFKTGTMDKSLLTPQMFTGIQPKHSSRQTGGATLFGKGEATIHIPAMVGRKLTPLFNGLRLTQGASNKGIGGFIDSTLVKMHADKVLSNTQRIQARTLLQIAGNQLKQISKAGTYIPKAELAKMDEMVAKVGDFQRAESFQIAIGLQQELFLSAIQSTMQANRVSDDNELQRVFNKGLKKFNDYANRTGYTPALDLEYMGKAPVDELANFNLVGNATPTNTPTNTVPMGKVINGVQYIQDPATLTWHQVK